MTVGPLLEPRAARVIEALQRLDSEEEEGRVPKSDRLVRCVSRAAAELLYTLVLVARPATILELGTSVGYSTIWLASAARRVDGKVVTVDREGFKVSSARRNLDEAGVASVVTTVEAEIPAVLAELTDRFDFVFVDVSSDLYADIFGSIQSLVNLGGFFFFDGIWDFKNWSSHPDLVRLRSVVAKDENFTGMLLPMEKGYFLAVRTGEVPVS
jgi:predicted O-methyltransferase YrrM